MRQGYSRQSWSKGEIPVVPFPAYLAKWHLAYSYQREIDLQVALYAKPATKLKPGRLRPHSPAVRREHESNRWLVSSFIPTPSASGDFGSTDDKSHFDPISIGTRDPSLFQPKRASGAGWRFRSGSRCGLLLIALGIVGIRVYQGKRRLQDVRARAPDAQRPEASSACSREPPVLAKDAAPAHVGRRIRPVGRARRRTGRRVPAPRQARGRGHRARRRRGRPDVPKAFAPRAAAVLGAARQFVMTAVARKHLDTSYDLVCPDMKDGFTRERWAKGEIPVVPFPVYFGKWRVAYSFEREVDVQVALWAKPKTKIKPVVFDLTLQPCGSEAGKPLARLFVHSRLVGQRRLQREQPRGRKLQPVRDRDA